MKMSKAEKFLRDRLESTLWVDDDDFIDTLQAIDTFLKETELKNHFL